MRQIQFLAPGNRDGGTQHPPGVLQHEVHLFGGYQLGGNDEIAFVFAVFVINHNDKIAGLEVFYGFFYRIQLNRFHIYFL